jgi:hypothetical protein
MDSQKLNKKIEETLGSFDAAKKATPNAFLLTRINARLQKETVPSFWVSAFNFISRPVVALVVTTLLIINMVIITQHESANTSNTSIQNLNTTKYDFAINVSSMYDVENQQ